MQAITASATSKCLTSSYTHDFRPPPPARKMRTALFWVIRQRVMVIHYIRFGTTYRSHLVNKANLVHNLFLVYLSISICFGRLCAHHQETQLCLCDTWYLLFCVDDCLVWRVDSTLHTRQSSTQNNKYQVSHKHSCFSWWWAHSRPKHIQIDKHTKNKLCTKLALFTRLHRDARLTKHKI